MKTFKDLEFNPVDSYGGVQAIIQFDNGYGASVVKHRFSYGYSYGFYELAVLDIQGNLCYTTPITSDVLGYLSEHEVTKILKDIQKL